MPSAAIKYAGGVKQTLFISFTINGLIKIALGYVPSSLRSNSMFSQIGIDFFVAIVAMCKLVATCFSLDIARDKKKFPNNEIV